jgi:prophage regulatory protein
MEQRMIAIEQTILNQKEVFRPKEVIKIVGKSRSQLWRDEKEGKFPRRVKIGARAVGWLRSDILSWLQGLKEQGTQNCEQIGQ